MTEIELKRKMKGLWVDTFHDSEDYVNLIFDTYFNPELVEYEEQSGEVVSALVGVPYEFGNSNCKVKALYLCGLATNPRYRSRGIMTRLLARINAKAREAGYAFTFLIPADSGLRLYYRDRGYVNAFYRVIDNYTSIHDFNLEYESLLMEQKEKVAELKRRLYESLRGGRLEALTSDEERNAVENGIVDLISEMESGQRDLRIIHSEQDLRTAIAENRIDKCGEIFYVVNPSGKVTAAAFTVRKDKNSPVEVRRTYASDTGSKFKLFQEVKRAYTDSSMQVYLSAVDMDRKALWYRTYGSVMPESSQTGTVSVTERVYSLRAHTKVYGMVKILSLYEILKFMAETSRDLKYSILVREQGATEVMKYVVRNGKISTHTLQEDEIGEHAATDIMSVRDVAEIIFRRQDGDSIITEAFGIPSINASISLMLD